jgi:Na+/H+ antiporter NhaD/arsenite permease-like protein
MTLGIAALALVWYRLRARWTSVRTMIRTLDWDTTFFLVGVFVVVGALTGSGWLDRLASWMAGVCGGSLIAAFLGIVLVPVIVSGFVDNVPFMLAMMPVAQRLADQLHEPVTVRMFGLLVGACLGGNITPIGASADVVTLGILRKRGHLVSFGTFMRMGVPFTIAATATGAAVIWGIWGR